MKQQISPPVIVAAVVVILVVVGAMAYMTLGSHKDTPNANSSNPMTQSYLKGNGSGGASGAGSPNAAGSPNH